MAYKDIKTSPKYKVKGGSAKAAYANGGRIAQGKGKTTVNIIVPQGAPPQVSAAPGGPMPPPPGPILPPGGAGAPPMPPGGAGAAGIKAMQGFRKGGRVKGGAASGEGRLDKIPAAKRTNRRDGGKAV